MTASLTEPVVEDAALAKLAPGDPRGTV